MKKWISLFVAALLTALAVVPAAADEAYQKGDANMDGRVTINDATHIQRYLAEVSACDSFWELFTADADNDGVVSINDVTTLQRELAQYYTLMGNVPDGNATIAQAAVSMAYPNKGDGYLTPGKQLYRDVLQLVLPGDGIVRSCDRFVCASVRWSGADDNYPAGHVGTQADYLDAHPEKWQSVFGSTFMVSDNYRHSIPDGLQPGDVVIEYSAYGADLSRCGRRRLQRRKRQLRRHRAAVHLLVADLQVFPRFPLQAIREQPALQECRSKGLSKNNFKKIPSNS